MRAPQGEQHRPLVPRWRGCCGEALDTNSDDVGFLAGVVAYAVWERAVDATRVYATGTSNGGCMARRLAVRATVSARRRFSEADFAFTASGVPAAEPRPASSALDVAAVALAAATGGDGPGCELR